MNELTIWEQQNIDFGTETEIIVDDPELAEASNEVGARFTLADGPIDHPEEEEIISMEFADGIDEIDKVDYAAAAACGVICAALDMFWLGKFNIKDAADFGSEQLGKFVIKAAKLVGYRGSNADEAIRKIISVCSPSGRNTQAGFIDLAQNASAAGLCFSILSQFTGKMYGTDADGRFSIRDLPDGQTAETDAEKILNGVLVWVLGSGRSIASDPDRMVAKGIPESVSSLIRDISQSPLFKMGRNRSSGKSDQEGGDVYSLVSQLLHGGFGLTEKDGRSFDLPGELGGQLDIARFSLSILINECMVRSFYMLRRLMMEIRNKNIKSYSDLSRIESTHFLPYNSRVITRMLTVSSGTFVAVTTAKAAVVAARSGMAGGWKGAVIDFVTHINYGGLISFAMACKADGEYVVSDARKAYSEMLAWKRLMKKEEQDMFRSFARMRLTEEQTRLLDNLKRQKLLYDIRAAKSLKELEKKQAWLFAWEDDVARSRGSDEKAYFIDDEDSIYDVINEKIEADDEELLWIYSIAIDLKLFAPYTGLEQTDNSGMLLRNDYETEVFCMRQSVVNAAELEEMIRMIESYVGILSSSEGQKNAGIAAAAIMTGGVALLPMAIARGRGKDVDKAAQTAVAKVNENVIRGANQIAGMFGNPASYMLSSGLSVPYDCARILTICDHVLKGRNNDLASIENINRYFYEQIVTIEGKIYAAAQEQQKRSETRKKVQRLENNRKYFTKCREILTEMCENW